MSEKRPNQPRFAPCETEKKVVRREWVDVDYLALTEIESGLWLPRGRYDDRHGYPTA